MTIDIAALDLLPEAETDAGELAGVGLNLCSKTCKDTCSWTCWVTDWYW